MKNSNPIVWFEIYVDDLSRAQQFYEQVLKISLTEIPSPIEDDSQMLIFPSDENGVGASGALCKMKGMKAGANSTLVYFGSEDCAFEEARIIKAGGKVFTSKQSLGEHGFIILAEDTEGNMFGVHSLK